MSQSVADFTVWKLAEEMGLTEWAELRVGRLSTLLQSTYGAGAETQAVALVHFALLREYYAAWEREYGRRADGAATAEMKEVIREVNAGIRSTLGSVRDKERKRAHRLLKTDVSADV